MSNVGVEPIFIQETHISLPSAFLMISGTRNLTFSIFHYLYPPCTWGTYLFFIIVVWMFFRGEYSLQTCRWSWSEPNGCGNANLCFLKNHILHFFFFFCKGAIKLIPEHKVEGLLIKFFQLFEVKFKHLHIQALQNALSNVASPFPVARGFRRFTQ